MKVKKSERSLPSKPPSLLLEVTAGPVNLRKAHPLHVSIDIASLAPSAEITALEGAGGAEGSHHQPRTHVPEATSDGAAMHEARDEVRRIAANIAKLLELARRT